MDDGMTQREGLGRGFYRTPVRSIRQVNTVAARKPQGAIGQRNSRTKSFQHRVGQENNNKHLTRPPTTALESKPGSKGASAAQHPCIIRKDHRQSSTLHDTVCAAWRNNPAH